MLQSPAPTKKTPFALFQREGTRNWSMRYSLGGKQYKKTLGTADEEQARQRAYEIWHEQSFRNKQGLSLDSHPFSEVAEEFIEKVVAEAERDERSKYHPIYWPPIIRRFPVGYFGDRPIETITTADIERYLEWRKTYWTTGPGLQVRTIRCEREDVRDEACSATKPVSTYLEAAAMTGRIVDEPELCRLPLTGKTPSLATPPSSKAVRGIFDQACRENRALEKLRGRSIYMDYEFP